MSAKKECIRHDYTATLPDAFCEITEDERQLFQKALDHFERINHLSYIVDPPAVKRFYRMVNACDLIAKEFSGKLEATVDHDTHTATILLECPYIDFDQGEFLETLQALTAIVYTIRFTPLISGLLQVEMEMPYFRLLHTDTPQQ